MRTLLLIPLLFAAGACSTKIYMSSEHADLLKHGTPRKLVIAEFGHPTSTSVKSRRLWRGRVARTDIYSTNARLPDVGSAIAAGMVAEMTFGLSEIFFVPYALIAHNFGRPKHLTIAVDRNAELLYY